MLPLDLVIGVTGQLKFQQFLTAHRVRPVIGRSGLFPCMANTSAIGF
jgi:hypothetical protein